jgi:Cytidylyltransferase-like
MTRFAAAGRAKLTAAIHATPMAGVLATTGGGVLLLADLLSTAGASATVLDARVPYASAALAEFIGNTPDQACSSATACDVAMAAWQRALTLAPGEPAARFGFGCSASLATLAPKRGGHRAYIALQTLASTRACSITFDKGARTRAAEERLLADVALLALADALGVPHRYTVPLGPGDSLASDAVDAPAAWRDVLLGRSHAVAIHDAASPQVLFPGAFNPLHDGHRALAAHAGQITGAPVAFEICANNVDKPRLNYLALRERLAQFDAGTPVWLTDTATFVEKARVFPGVTFAVGSDTLMRIADPKYYGDDAARLEAAVAEIGALGCRFLVFGRHLDGRFVTLDDIALPASLRALCRAVPETEFRHDASSSLLRRDRAPHG